MIQSGRACRHIPPLAVTGAFMAGRLVTYSLCLGGAAATEKSLGGTSGIGRRLPCDRCGAR